MLMRVCGVAGGWSREGVPADADRLRAGLAAIAHRGPDDVGEFVWHDPSSRVRVDLGLVRLAILDLSPAGHQPMSLPGGRFTISYNGEITNYIELREELAGQGETFVSDGDTEVLLKAWARWGISTLDRLEGMFAISILDTHLRTLTLARDPYGIKPLFYQDSGDHVRFNSELKGLLASGVTPKLDWQTAVDYLQWGSYDHTERTFLDGVRQLRPAHYLVIDTVTGHVGEPVRYWWPSVEATYTGSYPDATDAVRSLFLDSVNRNLRSDVPLGIALSGGIDSSAIVGAARYLHPELPINTFSFIAPGFARSEHEWIARVVSATDAISHTVQAAPGDLERDLDDLILTQGEPFGSTSIYAQYRVFQLARQQGVTVTLDGQGGDEIFAGYSGYPAQRMHTLIETGHFARASSFARHWATWPDRNRNAMIIETAGRFAPSSLRGRILRKRQSPLLDATALRDRGISTLFPIIDVDEVRGRRLPSHLRTTLSRYGLPALLRHADRNSMRFSIESRVPFLDRALSEFVLSLPEDWLVGPDGTSKRILRDAVSGLVPEAIINRRDKVGFETPEQDWLERLGALPNDPDHPVPFLRPGLTDTLTGGLTEDAIRWNPRSHWRLINLRRWMTLNHVDAGGK